MMTNAVTELVIRPFHASDEDQVVDLWHRCGLVVPRNDPKQDIARKLHVQPELFLVGILDGRVAATVMAGYEGRRGWINYLAVAPNRQRLGIGRQMMQAAERALRGLGCPKINLLIRTSNRAVIAFYERLGYSIDEVVSMGKRLN
jgi:ribosomal protein S18 acetylase RimI-like enzyme